MTLVTLARRLRDEAVEHLEQESGQKPQVEDITLTGAPADRAEAFAVAFRVRNPWGPRSNEFTVTISESHGR